ncbi:hypothetical protein EV182_003113 [Spiromyces aspiralis]|uniref:Uncharacterized protein n=1 Tax=Spiromyces aspiralis TaxID=68401 RepID=A0ACC1HRK0_9FUNG|nr:hypothetical protein EV182_003113 [Spiromyces aspiralis]
MTPLDFITFTGQYQSTISHFRVIRDLSTPNRYMVLLFFESRQDADTFHHFYNGRTFSPLEPELCHVVYLESAVCQMVEHKLPTWYSLLGEAGTADQSAGNDSSTADHRVIEKIVPLKELTLHPRHIPRPPRDQRQGSQDRGNGQEFVELPTCPVCLERLDCTVSGLLTIICQHTFHCRCLSMWGDGNCPVCRYTQMSPFVDQTKFEATIGSLARQRELQLPLSPKINRRAESVGVRDQPQMPKRRDSQGRAKQTSAEPAADHQQQVPDSKRRQQFGKPPGGTVASSISCERSLSAAEGAAEKKSESPSEPDERPRCATCGATQNLWVCLVCGSVGCGRYDSAHAHAHFMKTQHPYSMELESQRVWDYVGDGYVHRLLKNKSDGKLVELPPPTVLGGSAPLVSRLSPFSRRQQQQQQQRSLGDRSLRAPNSDQGLKSSSEEQAMPGSHQYPDPASPHYSSLQTLPSSSGYDTVMREKVDAIAEEYELLLTSQLESQRRHYESLLNDQAKSIRKFQFELKNAAATIKAQSSQISTLKKSLEEQEQARKDHQATICTKFSEFESEVSALRRKLAEERATNEHLRQSQNKLKETLEKNNARISELEEQSNDLMAFLDAKEKIENDETLKAQVEGGSVVVGQSPAETSGGARASKKKKGKSKAKPPVVVRKS